MKHQIELHRDLSEVLEPVRDSVRWLPVELLKLVEQRHQPEQQSEDDEHSE